MSTSGVRRRPTSGVVVGASLAVVAAFIGADSLHDNSFLTHLATGRIILDGGIPRADPYTFTAAGEPWVVQSWLASWIFATLERGPGLDAVRLLVAAMAASLAACTWVLTRGATTLLPRVAVAGLTMVVGAQAWSERPLMFGLLGFALTLLVLHGALPRWLLLPVGWIWVNTHGSFPLGIALVVVVLVGELLDGERPPPSRAVLVWLGAGILGGVLNPLGWRLLWFPVELLGRGGALRDLVVEWQPPEFTSPDELAFLVLVLAVAVAARGSTWRDLLPALAFVGLALLSRRNIPVAALAAAPVLAAAVPRLGSLRSDDRPARSAPVLVTVAVLGASGLAAYVARTPTVDLDPYPVEEVSWMEERDLIASARLVSPDYVGNYLTARFGAEGIVFFDDRFDMFPEPVLDDYTALITLDDPGRVLDRWEAELVLWPDDEPLAAWLEASADWRPLHRGDRYVVWCAVGSGPCS